MTVVSERLTKKVFSDGRAEGTNRVLLYLGIAFGLSSSLSKIGLFDLANKAIIGFMCLVILALFYQRPQPRSTFLILSIAMILHVVAFAFPVSSRDGIAVYFTFAFWILFWLYLVHNMGIFLKASRKACGMLQLVLVVWSLVTVVSFLMPSCYKLGWGGVRYFTSFTTDSFEIAPVAMFMLALNILLFAFDKNKVKALVFSIVPLACVFAAGTRTYLIVVLIEFAILLRLMIRRTGVFALTLGVFIVCCVIFACMTNIGQKFASAMFETTDPAVFLEVFTNGRSEFWQVDLEAFLESDWFTMLFGHGFSYVYDLNLETIGIRLYAHNDFLNVLLNFGVLGLFVYFAAFLPVIFLMRKVGRVGTGLCAAFAIMWLFNAFFNMIYVYVVAVVGMGVLAAALIKAEASPVTVSEKIEEKARCDVLELYTGSSKYHSICR